MVGLGSWVKFSTLGQLLRSPLSSTPISLYNFYFFVFSFFSFFFLEVGEGGAFFFLEVRERVLRFALLARSWLAYRLYIEPEMNERSSGARVLEWEKIKKKKAGAN